MALPVALVGAGACLGAPAVAQTPVIVNACDEDALDGWEVIEEASGASELNVVCNFLVTDPVEEIGHTYVSGVAITIDYFCNAADAQQSFKDRTGPRKTEVLRTPTKVVTQEGPAAKNKDNPQPDLITGFGPELYALQEKAWELLSPQIVATIYVLTNEQEALPDDQRLGVNMAEPAAIIVANNHLPTECNVPAIGQPPTGEKGGTSAPGTKKAKGGKGRIAVIGGIGGLITIGGVVVWKRKPGKPLVRPASPFSNVPPQCQQHSQDFESKRETLLTLREAFEDMNNDLLTAQTRQANNYMKWAILCGIDAGSYVATAVGSAMGARPRTVTRAPVDTWQPPGSLSAKMSRAFQQALEAFEKLHAKVSDLRNRVKSALAGLSNLAGNPLVQEAERDAAAATAAVARAEQGLSASTIARTRIDKAEALIEKLSPIAAENNKLVEGAEKMVKQWEGWIADAEGDIIKMTETIDGANPLATAAANPKLDMKKQSLASMKKSLADAKSHLSNVQMNAQNTNENLAKLMNDHDGGLRDLAKAGDVQPRDVERLKANQQKMIENTSAVKNKVMGELNAKYDAAREALTTAELEESLAEAYFKGLRAQLEKAESFGKKSLDATVKVVTFPLLPILLPLDWLIVKGFGRTQSVKEGWEILARGQIHITELSKNLKKIARGVETMTRQTEQARKTLQRCIDAAKAGETPMVPPVPGAPLPPPATPDAA